VPFDFGELFSALGTIPAIEIFIVAGLHERGERSPWQRANNRCRMDTLRLENTQSHTPQSLTELLSRVTHLTHFDCTISDAVVTYQGRDEGYQFYETGLHPHEDTLKKLRLVLPTAYTTSKYADFYITVTPLAAFGNLLS
jgi:hypothetical protein